MLAIISHTAAKCSAETVAVGVAVAKKAAVAIAAQPLLHLAPRHPQRNALLHLRLPRVGLMTWTTISRSDQLT